MRGGRGGWGEERKVVQQGAHRGGVCSLQTVVEGRRTGSHPFDISNIPFLLERGG